MDEKHAPTPAHNHNHDHTHTREVVNRLARAIGHLQKVKQMVEDGEGCSQVLVQLAAVKSALNSTGKVILKDHLEHCIVHAVEDGDTEMLTELSDAIDRFVKYGNRCNPAIADEIWLPLFLSRGDSPQCGEMSRSDRGDGHRLGAVTK